ncbi:MAG: DUF433 domain-containing protein [Chromatiaceae bacterium]
MRSTYIDHEHGAYRVAGTRVSLDSVVYAYLNGQTAEAIAQAFPLVTLEQVYGALAYYLAHRETIDAYLRQGSQDFERLRQTARDADPMWHYKLEEARRSAA